MPLRHTPVVFLDARGKYITNDPVLKAHQMLGEDISELVGKPVEPAMRKASGPADDEALDVDRYADMNGKQLKDEAKQRGVDIKGLKTVGEVREALREADEAAAQKSESETNTGSTDDGSDEDEDDEEE